ncbi:hypothetical protein [Solimicrobium silvestre]|uniref:Uncharacterized protein n=1 Tax=Solimicrobium silvestre TaxID=2099400 RepID=A0A2S9GSY7_9BURK|nr:hypothetical protein [Solimicrobium silvestre]PRC90827.1 hypothetical protein S2091_4490 [Solimicrobium silvestre]
MIQSKRALITVFFLFLIDVCLSGYFRLRHSEMEGLVSTVCNIGVGIAVYCWYYSDSEVYKYERSGVLNFCMIFLTIFAMPYYLIRSRPTGQKGKALLKCIGFCAAVLLISIIMEIFMTILIK